MRTTAAARSRRAPRVARAHAPFGRRSSSGRAWRAARCRRRRQRGAAPGAARRLAARAAPGEVGWASAPRQRCAAPGRARRRSSGGGGARPVAAHVRARRRAGPPSSRDAPRRRRRRQDEPGARVARAARRRPSWHVGRCLAYGRAITYRPLAEILRAHARRRRRGPARGDPRAARRPRLPRARARPRGRGRAAPAARRASGSHEAWIDAPRRDGRRRPPSVVVEDLHWAEERAARAARPAAARAAGPLLLSSRPGPSCSTAAGWGAGHGASRGSGSSRSPTGEEAELLDAPRGATCPPPCASSCSSAPRATPSSSRRCSLALDRALRRGRGWVADVPAIRLGLRAGA